MKTTVRLYLFTILFEILCLEAIGRVASAFLVPTAFVTPHSPSRTIGCTSYCPPLRNGVGVATTYSWTEDPTELDITVSVPQGTRAKNIVFKAKQTSIDLRLKMDAGEDVILLDGNRQMRGRVSLDGTYWIISDNEEDPSKRLVTVTVEKNIRTPNDDFEIVEYDWKGVYPNDDEEVIERKYDEPEELNVREYAASLGVDIDNINMSKVDKTMFSSGLNMTRSTLDELTKKGYVQEVTQQADGKEYTQNEEGEAVPFSSMGDNIGQEEMKQAAKIPFLDTTSPWHNTVPVEDVRFDSDANDGNSTGVAADHDESAKPKASVKINTESVEDGADKNKAVDKQQASDPIDTLTVKRLREVLRDEGLKVSGNKQELRDRLRNHVQGMLQQQKKPKEEQ